MKHENLILAALLLPACSKPAPMAFERPPSPVVVAAAVKKDVPLYLDEIGKCVAKESVSIEPQVSGRITEVHFQDGADVKTGELLFTIDARPYQAKLASAQASLAQAKAARDLAKLEVARIGAVADPRAVSQQDRDTKKSALEVAEALVLQDEATAHSAELDLEYCSIHSPIDGRAGRRLVDPGNVVTVNATTQLLVIERLDPLYAEFTVNEEELTAVQRHMKSGKLAAEVRLPDEPADPRTAELTFLDNTVQATSGTVRLRATVPNADHKFWPGRFVRVRLILDTLSGVVLVPTSAPGLSAKGPFVFVVKDDGTAELRPVKAGQRHGDLVVIESGVEAGEKVVVDGQIGVMPGGKVRVLEPGAPTSPGAPGGTPGAVGATPAKASGSGT
jgi:multidrug efflux system membrane fusion protein